MKKNVIVSLADSNYFPLLNELIDSIKRFKESSEVAICILDAGLSEDQKTELLSTIEFSVYHSTSKQNGKKIALANKDKRLEKFLIEKGFEVINFDKYN